MYLKASKHMNRLFLLVIIISELLLVKGLKLCQFPVMSFANNSSAKNTGINVNSNNLLSHYTVGLLGCNAMWVCVRNTMFTYRSLSAQWPSRGKSSRCCSFQDNQGRAPPLPTPYTVHRTELSERDSHRKKALETNFLSSASPLCCSLILLILNYFSCLIPGLPY